MQKSCLCCANYFADGERVVAMVVTDYHKTDSKVSYAIGHPEKCEGLLHPECLDHVMRVANDAAYGADEDDPNADPDDEGEYV